MAWKNRGKIRVMGFDHRVYRTMILHTHLKPNVDFYSSSVYRMLGFPNDLFTTIFACSRVAGWTAHILEQYDNNRLIRPRAEYTGRRDVPYTPRSERGLQPVSSSVEF